MALFFAFSLVLLLVFYFMIKDRRYLRKQTREVVSDDVKKLLNIPTANDEFPTQVLPKIPKQSASAKLMQELNQDES